MLSTDNLSFRTENLQPVRRTVFLPILSSVKRRPETEDEAQVRATQRFVALFKRHRARQRDFAATVGWPSPSTVGHILKGRHKLPMRHLDAVAKYFGVPVSYFVDPDPTADEALQPANGPANIGAHPPIEHHGATPMLGLQRLLVLCAGLTADEANGAYDVLGQWLVEQRTKQAPARRRTDFPRHLQR